MNDFLKICSISLILIIVGSVDSTSLRSSKSLQVADPFDYVILREIWPPATCMFPEKHTCAIAKNISTWVVHGLWPSIKGKLGPTDCNKTAKFDPRTIDWLLPQLLQFWPNLYTDTPLESFWQHEWEKHGTCAIGLPGIFNESGYFNTSLGLRSKFEFGPILKANSIVPDDTVLYDLKDIENAIIKTMGVKPLVVCYVLKDSDVQYLSQMQICLSKTFELTDCAFKSVELTNIATTNDPQETQCQLGIPVHYTTIHYKFNQM